MSEITRLSREMCLPGKLKLEGELLKIADKTEKGHVETDEMTGINEARVSVLCASGEKEKSFNSTEVNVESFVPSTNKCVSIMDLVQIGIRRSLSRFSAEPERDILMNDFMSVETMKFSIGELTTKNEFIFKIYAPEAFRYFRHLFGINSEMFLSSLCSEPLLELTNSGASGSLFYVTRNNAFITKTVQYSEAEFLQKLLPGYYLNLSQNPQTLLPKFFGLYCYKRRTINRRLIVMSNIFPSSIKIHKKYDLKGSTYNRTASKTERQKDSPTFKDLDFMRDHPEGIFLDIDNYKTLMTTIESDCRVLESFEIMDYSLLLAIHNLDHGKGENSQMNPINQSLSNEEAITKTLGDGIGEIGEGITKKENQRIDNSLVMKYNTNVFSSGLPARQANGDHLLLFVGIIDILQSFKLRKRVEHILKSIVHDSNSISVNDPTFYSKRFKHFLTNTVFKETFTTSKIKKPASKSNIVNY